MGHEELKTDSIRCTNCGWSHIYQRANPPHCCPQCMASYVSPMDMLRADMIRAIQADTDRLMGVKPTADDMKEAAKYAEWAQSRVAARPAGDTIKVRVPAQYAPRDDSTRIIKPRPCFEVDFRVLLLVTP